MKSIYCPATAFSPIAGRPLRSDIAGSWNVVRGDARNMLVAPRWKSQVRESGLTQTSFTKVDNNVLM